MTTLETVLAIVGGVVAVATPIFTFFVGRYTARAERRNDWRNARLEELADLIGQISAAVEEFSMMTPLAEEAPLEEREVDHEKAHRLAAGLWALESRLSAMSNLVRDRALGIALEEVKSLVLEFLQAQPHPEVFLDGVEEVRIESEVTRITVDIDTAVRAAHWRIEQLVAGDDPEMDDGLEEDLLEVLSGQATKEREEARSKALEETMAARLTSGEDRVVVTPASADEPARDRSPETESS